MSASTVLEDSSKLSKLDLLFLKLESKMTVLSGFCILFLILLAAVNIFGRNLFNLPVPGYIDFIEQFMALIALFGISHCQRDGVHVRMDILISRLKGRALWFFEIITLACILIVTLAVTYGAYHHFLRSFDFTRPLWSNDSTIDINLPIWPAKLMVMIALIALSIRATLQLITYMKAFKNNTTHPAAVPLIQDAAAQAASESKGSEVVS